MTGRDHPENLGRIDKADSDGRVNGLEEGKTMEIGVRGVDSPDPVLLHEDCRLGVIEEVAGRNADFFMTMAATSACLCEGTRRPKAGEARSAST